MSSIQTTVTGTEFKKKFMTAGRIYCIQAGQVSFRVTRSKLLYGIKKATAIDVFIPSETSAYVIVTNVRL